MPSLVETAKTIYDLVKKGASIELREKVMELRDEALLLEEENFGLKKENMKLKKKIELQENLKFKRHVYWREGDEAPFCPYCYEKKGLLIHFDVPGQMADRSKLLYVCQDCGIRYITIGQEDFIAYDRRGKY